MKSQNVVCRSYREGKFGSLETCFKLVFDVDVAQADIDQMVDNKKLG